jgi:hypothetical protein
MRLGWRIAALGGALAIMASAFTDSAGVVGAAGNGVEAMPADAIVAKAVKTTEAAPSYTVVGRLSDNGKTIRLRFSYDKAGDIVGTEQYQGTISVIEEHGELYLKEPQYVWHEQGLSTAEAAQLANRWVKIPSKSELGQAVVGPKGLGGFGKEILGGLISSGPFITNGTAVVGGRRVVVLSDDAQTETFDVAASGPPFLVRISASDDSLTFSGFGAKVGVAPPVGAIPLP